MTIAAIIDPNGDNDRAIRLLVVKQLDPAGNKLTHLHTIETKASINNNYNVQNSLNSVHDPRIK